MRKKRVKAKHGVERELYAQGSRIPRKEDKQREHLWEKEQASSSEISGIWHRPMPTP